MTALLTDKEPALPDFSLDFDNDLISHTLEYRGCGIRAASYEVQAQSWLPEACVWLHTEEGHRKIWVHSFSHCFSADELTFPNKFDADHWALDAAKSIIDRALDLSQLLRPARVSKAQFSFFSAFRVKTYSVFKRNRLRDSRSSY